jgi:hypothetical protein
MGRQFGLDRLRDHLARPSAPDRWSLSLAQAVEQWRGRIGDDDVLVATVRTPEARPPRPRTRSLAEDIEMDTSLGLSGVPAPAAQAAQAGASA